MKQLLLITDLSEDAEKALNYAHWIAQKHKAQLTMLYFFSIPASFALSSPEDYEVIETKMEQDGCEKLKILYRKTVREDEDISEPSYMCKELVSLVDDVLEVCKEIAADLLILGKSSGSGSGVVSSYVYRQLIRQATCPVLLVPFITNRTGLKKVAYATDLMEYDLDSIVHLLKLIRPFHAELWILHVLNNGGDREEETMEWFKELLLDRISYRKLKFRLLKGDNVYQKLISYTHSRNFDLLVMLEREHKGFFDHLFHEDLVIKAGTEGNCPLLSFNENSLKSELIMP